MRLKLGLFNEEAEDETLIENLLSMMHKAQADYTNTFRALTFACSGELVLILPNLCSGMKSGKSD